MRKAYDDFHFILEKTPKIEPKNQFCGSFSDIFGICFLTPYELHSNLLPN